MFQKLFFLAVPTVVLLAAESSWAWGGGGGPNGEPFDPVTLTTVLVPAIFAMGLAIITTIFVQRDKESRTVDPKRKELLKETINRALNKEPFIRERWSEDELNYLVDQIVTQTSLRPDLVPEKFQEAVTKELKPLHDKIAEIDARFPSDAEFDKYANVNEALLKFSLDQLKKQTDALESRILSKWEVAKVVGVVMFSFYTVASIAIAALLYILDNLPDK